MSKKIVLLFPEAFPESVIGGMVFEEGVLTGCLLLDDIIEDNSILSSMGELGSSVFTSDSNKSENTLSFLRRLLSDDYSAVDPSYISTVSNEDEISGEIHIKKIELME